MQGGFGTAVLGMLVVFGVNMAGSYIASFLFAGNDTLSLILYQVFLFVISLISAVFSAGLSVMYLNIAREQPFSLKDLGYFFQKSPDRVIVAAFVLAVINTLVSIPYYYYGLTATIGETLEEQTRYLVITLVLLILSQALYTILTIPFSMTYYLMADDNSLAGPASLKESIKLMRGAKMKYFLLLLSYVPLLALSVFTLYVALLWILPGMNMAKTVFYLKLQEQRYYEKQAVEA